VLSLLLGIEGCCHGGGFFQFNILIQMGQFRFFKISGVHFAFHKLGACDNLLQKLQISANAANLEFIQCSKQAPNGSITVFTPGNDLCQQ